MIRRFAMGVLLSASLAPAASLPLAGRWESVARSSGGIGTTLELRADGTLESTIGAMVDATYRVDGGTLVTSYTDEKTGRSQEVRLTIRIDGDTLTESSPATRGREITMKREDGGKPGGKPGDPPIVGTWSAPQTRGMAYTTFTADGREIFRYPIKSATGRWSASGDLLMLTYGQRPPETSRYSLEKDVLTIDRNGQASRYRRAVP